MRRRNPTTILKVYFTSTGAGFCRNICIEVLSDCKLLWNLITILHDRILCCESGIGKMYMTLENLTEIHSIWQLFRIAIYVYLQSAGKGFLESFSFNFWGNTNKYRYIVPRFYRYLIILFYNHSNRKLYMWKLLKQII